MLGHSTDGPGSIPGRTTTSAPYRGKPTSRGNGWHRAPLGRPSLGVEIAGQEGQSMSEQENEAAAAVAEPAAAEPAAEQVEEQVPRSEVDALRRKLAEEERARKRLEDQQKKATEARAAEQGEWQKLAEQRAAELEQERTERTRVEREQRIARLAGRMKFVDTQDAVLRVRGEDGDSDEAAMAALALVAEQSPHLIAKDAPARPEIGVVHTPDAQGLPGTPGVSADGKPAPPAGKQAIQSLDEWEALPQAERIARMAEADWLAVREK